MKQDPQNCPVCSSPSVHKYHQVQGHPIMKCSACQVEFIDPPPPDDLLNSIYSENYFIGSENDIELQRTWALKRATAKRYLKQIKAITRMERAEILEIGCGDGDFLVEAQAEGFVVSGLEISPYAVSRANKRLLADRVMCGSFDQLVTFNKVFDVIAMFDVIEHFHEPQHLMNEVSKHLKPGGFIVIVTPSLDSWSKKLLSKNWMEYKIEHIWYFSKKSIQILLGQSGFSNSRWFSNKKVLSIDYIRMHFQKYHVPFFSTLIAVFCKFLPKQIAQKSFSIVASGMAVIAQKGA